MMLEDDLRTRFRIWVFVVVIILLGQPAWLLAVRFTATNESLFEPLVYGGLIASLIDCHGTGSPRYRCRHCIGTDFQRRDLSFRGQRTHCCRNVCHHIQIPRRRHFGRERSDRSFRSHNRC